MKKHYEPATEYPAEAYRIDGFSGIACRILGWETEPDEDTEWTGYEQRTGRLVVVMIGDDHRFTADPEDVHELADDEFCWTCGQIGCPHTP